MVLGGAGGGLRGMLRAEIMDTARDQFLVDVWIIFLTRGYPLRMPQNMLMKYSPTGKAKQCREPLIHRMTWQLRANNFIFSFPLDETEKPV